LPPPVDPRRKKQGDWGTETRNRKLGQGVHRCRRAPASGDICPGATVAHLRARGLFFADE
jgi:hypothetical protein